LAEGLIHEYKHDAQASELRVRTCLRCVLVLALAGVGNTSNDHQGRFSVFAAKGPLNRYFVTVHEREKLATDEHR